MPGSPSADLDAVIRLCLYGCNRMPASRRYATYVMMSSCGHWSSYSDIDECARGLDNCKQKEGDCVNTPGSFTCGCGNYREEKEGRCVGKSCYPAKPEAKFND